MWKVREEPGLYLSAISPKLIGINLGAPRRTVETVEW
jgi:hypothetical protein